MKDYSEMSDFEINKLVARAMDGLSGDENTACDCYLKSMRDDSSVRVVDDDIGYHHFDYCNKPSDAWPIIVKNGISIVTDSGVLWCADNKAYWVDGVEWQINGVWHKNPLRAAMIVFLMMQEGKC